MWVFGGREAAWAGGRGLRPSGPPQAGDVATICSRGPLVDVRREVTGVSGCEGAAVGVELGFSAYPSFPILPSLSPYPIPLPTAFVPIGSFGGDAGPGAVPQVYPYPYFPSLSR